MQTREKSGIPLKRDKNKYKIQSITKHNGIWLGIHEKKKTTPYLRRSLWTVRDYEKKIMRGLPLKMDKKNTKNNG